MGTTDNTPEEVVFIERNQKTCIAEAIGEVLEATKDGVPKTGRNNHGGYNYASEDDVLNTIRPAMGKAGLILIPSTSGPARIEHGQTQKGSSNVTAYVTMEYTLAHVSGAVWPEKLHSEGMATDTQDKAVAQAITSAHKYFMLKFFMLATDQDPDRDKQDQGAGSSTSPSGAVSPSQSGPSSPPVNIFGQTKHDFEAAVKYGGLDELNAWWGINKDRIKEEATESQYTAICIALKNMREEWAESGE